MELFLVRHAEPEWVRDGFLEYHPPLTNRWQEQAKLLAKFLAEEHFDEILVSPLVRTRQTAAPLLDVKQADLVIEPWLEEIRNPIWHGTPEERAEEAYRAVRQQAARDRWQGLEGGEPVNNFVERIHLGCSLFLQERGIERKEHELPVWETNDRFNPDSRIALVAHAGTNSVVMCHLLGLLTTPWEWERFVIGHATVSRIRSITLGDGITFGLTSLSDDEHLPKDMRTF